jgi:hypothetical protein
MGLAAGALITRWGREHEAEMYGALQVWLDKHESEGETFEAWIIRQDMFWRNWVMHSDHFPYSAPIEVGMPFPWTAKGLNAKMRTAGREIENNARVLANMPKVGQGWISETELYELIRIAFENETPVIQHGSPAWLGQQHLGVWIPMWNVAIEYQGLQHDQPVEFFGGGGILRRTTSR